MSTSPHRDNDSRSRSPMARVCCRASPRDSACRGTLQFDDASLDSVLAQLERWYDLDIQTPDRSLQRARLTIAFTTASPDEALSTLARVLGARFTREDRAVRLVPGQPDR